MHFAGFSGFLGIRTVGLLEWRRSRPDHLNDLTDTMHAEFIKIHFHAPGVDSRVEYDCPRHRQQPFLRHETSRYPRST